MDPTLLRQVKDDTLSRAELNDHLSCVLAKNPLMEHQADFELECCRECLLWIRFLFENSKDYARALAMTVGALTMYRAYLSGGCPLEDIKFVDYQIYKEAPYPIAMVMKIQKFVDLNGRFVDESMQAQIINKYAEIQSSIAWLKNLVTHEAELEGRLRRAFYVAHVALVDALTTLDCYMRAKIVDGRVVIGE